MVSEPLTASCSKDIVPVMQTLTRGFRPVLTTLTLCSALFLAGCKSDAEQAEDYFQSGMTYLQEGQTERALLEFRNVFNHDGFHKEARQTYADTLVTLGRIQEAYGQYLRLIEQYPDTVEVRQILAEIAISRNDWPEAERHGTAAIALAPERPGVQAIDLALQYRTATLARDTDARARIAAESATLLDQLRQTDGPDNTALARIVIDQLVSSDTPANALPALDAALARTPDALDLQMAKAQLLAQLGDTAGTGTQLRLMAEQFPDNTDIQQALLRWYLSQNDTDGAEGYIRQLAGDATGPTEGHVSVVQLLASLRGVDAARAELERLIAANGDSENGRLYTGMLGALEFEAGRTEAGIAALRQSLDGAEPGDQTRRMQAMLARMLIATGARDEAAALVDEVLTQDPTNVDALKLRANALIDGDRPGEAIIALRTALDQAPRDPDVLTLMARAHERDGDTDLVGERLALAVEVSGARPAEAMRYARFLMQQGRPVVAIAVLEDARQRAPGDIETLLLLAELHLQQRDWPNAQTVAETLRGIDSDRARQAAPALQAAILQGQNRAEDSLALLEAELGSGTSDQAQDIRATVLIVQTQIRSGKIAEARTFLDEALSETPDAPDLQMLSASVDALMGNTEKAEASYRDLIARFPAAELPARLLIGLLSSTGRQGEAETLLQETLTRLPAAPNLLWMQAGILEGRGDIDGAIAVYEALYANDSNNTIIANNLASMITTHRTDPESLDRAWAIARRLRGTDVPAFQDTYGWIAHRRGNMEEALEYLEPAAASLPRDPLVQYHLGMTYAALNRPDDARATLTLALELAADSPLEQFRIARETLATLGN